MCVLVADVHPDEHRAAAVLAALHRLRAIEALGLRDAVVLIRHANSRITVRRDPAAPGATDAGPALWDALATVLVMSAPPAPGTGGTLRPRWRASRPWG